MSFGFDRFLLRHTILGTILGTIVGTILGTILGNKEKNLKCYKFKVPSWLILKKFKGFFENFDYNSRAEGTSWADGAATTNVWDIYYTEA